MSGDARGIGPGDGVDRRGFLGRAAALLGGAALGGVVAPDPLRALAARTIMTARPRAFDVLGVQLYTLRSLMSESVPDTLATVAEIGYREVELAGIFGHTPAEFRRMLDDHGLRAPSTHVGLGSIEPDHLEETLDTASALGSEWVIVPSLAPGHLTPQGLPSVVETMNRAGEVAKARGIGIGFHNHSAEFEPWEDGRFPLQFMLEESEPEFVSFQLDLFWIVHAGHDPMHAFANHPGRFVSVHVKDRTLGGDMVPVGNGVIDFATILPAAEAAGVRHAFVEHDRPEDPQSAVRSSYLYLRSILG